MTFSKRKKWGAFAIAAVAVPLLTVATYQQVQGSDHAGTVETVNKPGTDLTDLHIFPSPADPSKVVLAMSVRPLIPAGQGSTVSFDPDVLYQFKIDTGADNVEDFVIQASFEGTGATQKVKIAGPVKPSRTGTITVFETPQATTGTINTTFIPTAGMKVFAGARKDPFFIDLDRLLVTKSAVDPPADPNAAAITTWRNPGVDFLANFNVLAIVVELPKASLGNGKIKVWETTSVRQ